MSHDLTGLPEPEDEPFEPDTVPGRCAAGDHSLCLIPDEKTGCPGFTPPEDEPFEPEHVRGKWMIDGAGSLEDAAAMAEEFAAYLRQLASQGYELDGPVEDDWGYLRKGTP